jgi:hypothetical protein
MTVEELNRFEEPETAVVVEWRFLQLERSGYTADAAIELATHLEVDLHQAAALAEQGCPDVLALAILL